MPSFSATWLPYIYLYAVGGFFFVAGLIIARKSNALDMSKKKTSSLVQSNAFRIFLLYVVTCLVNNCSTILVEYGKIS